MIWIRVSIAVLLGYLLMTLSYALTMVPAITLVSPDRLRDPETGLMTNWFIFMVQFPVAIFTAVIGGVVAAFLATSKGRAHAIKGLVGFVIIVGLLGAAAGQIRLLREEVTAVTQVDSGPSSDEIAKDESGMPPRQPMWNLLLLPFVGGLGVLLGGRFVERMSVGLAPSPPGAIPPPSSPENVNV